MLEGKRIFITGGAGFIGTTLAREIVERNEIVAYDNLHRDVLSGTDLGEHPNFTLVQGDILDPDALRAAAAGATHFVHCAAIAGVDTVLKSPVRVMRVNVVGTYNALEAALATLPTLERFIDFSTSEIFGQHAANVAEGHVSTIGSVGEARWTYVSDMVTGVLACLEHPDAVGQAFNIGNPRGTVTIYDLAQRIRRISGEPIDIVFQPLHYTDVELRIPNVEKARTVLGWEPLVELDDGLEKTVAWYRARALASA